MSVYLGSNKINFIDDIIIDNDLIFENYIKNKLTNLNLEELKELDYIRPYSFYNNEYLNSIYFPENLKEIGDYAFYGCSNLKEITCHMIVPPSYNDSSDYYFGDNIETIYIPVGTIDSYLNANGWNKYSDKFVEKDGV